MIPSNASIADEMPDFPDDAPFTEAQLKKYAGGNATKAPSRKISAARDEESADEKPAIEKPAQDEETLDPNVEQDPSLDEPDLEEPEQETAPSDEDERDEKIGRAKADKDLDKRLEAVRKAERRAKEQLADARAEWKREQELERTKMAPRLAKLEEYETLAKRARHDLGAVLEHFGFTEDDFDTAARSLYARTAKGKADPANRAYVERTAREREQAERLATLEKKLAETEERDRKQAAQAESERAAVQYIDKTVKLVGDESPLVRALHQKNPAKARQGLLLEALRIAEEEGGDEPDPRDVVAAYEKTRKAELEELAAELDVPLATLLKQERAAGELAAMTAANGKKPSRTLGGGAAGRTATKPKPSAAELDAQLAKDLEDDRFA